MIRTILIDDEPRGLSALTSMLAVYCPELEILAACSEVPEAIDNLKRLRPQLVFLDISLKNQTAFDLLADLKEIDFEIIFVTAHNQYMLRAFQYSATDYLLKPIDEDLLVKAVKRAAKRIAGISLNSLPTLLYNINKLHAQKEMKLCVPSLKGFDVIDIQHILYLEAAGVYTNIYFAARSQICSSKGLSEYEKLLSDAGFVRTHNSYLVNLLHIRRYVKGEGGSVILSNNVEIGVSRRKKERIIQIMKEIYRF